MTKIKKPKKRPSKRQPIKKSPTRKSKKRTGGKRFLPITFRGTLKPIKVGPVLEYAGKQDIADGRTSRVYAARNYWDPPLPREAARVRIDKWLGEYIAKRGKLPYRGPGVLSRAQAWFDRTTPPDLIKMGATEPLFARVNVVLFDPNIRGKGDAGYRTIAAITLRFEEITADKFVDMMPRQYLLDGLLYTGARLKFYTLPRREKLIAKLSKKKPRKPKRKPSSKARTNAPTRSRAKPTKRKNKAPRTNSSVRHRSGTSKTGGTVKHKVSRGGRVGRKKVRRVSKRKTPSRRTPKR